ncbi:MULTISPECIES: hypothetical protein [unclassified Arthrobacter]|uniref:hypothetical protein n=1 Tax=unclassified Arthrobacter TaxID=235627 RepID=UPI001F3BDC9D|nr:hypothetical protein [Arthrobacter sp. FW305-BF8]UKA56253.1 hypothetical protein LFT45_10290 [Arthrobacter sp. FW305-BF8]
MTVLLGVEIPSPLGAAGRNTALASPKPLPCWMTTPRWKGHPQHTATKKKLRRYWMDFGFREAAGDYLYFEAA